MDLKKEVFKNKVITITLGIGIPATFIIAGVLGGVLGYYGSRGWK
jgi:hypothetical protein